MRRRQARPLGVSLAEWGEYRSYAYSRWRAGILDRYIWEAIVQQERTPETKRRARASRRAYSTARKAFYRPLLHNGKKS